MDIDSSVNKTNFNTDLPPRVDPLKQTNVPNFAATEVQSEIEFPVPEVGQLVESAVQNNAENLQEAINRVSEFTQNLQRDLQFRVDDLTGKQVVTVLDSETQEVIRQVPSEEMLELSHNLEQLRTNGQANLFFSAEV